LSTARAFRRHRPASRFARKPGAPRAAFARASELAPGTLARDDEQEPSVGRADQRRRRERATPHGTLPAMRATTHVEGKAIRSSRRPRQRAACWPRTRGAARGARGRTARRCSVAWIRALSASLLPFTDAGAGRAPIARPTTLAARPGRASGATGRTRTQTGRKRECSLRRIAYLSTATELLVSSCSLLRSRPRRDSRSDNASPPRERIASRRLAPRVAGCFAGLRGRDRRFLEEA
jgi:hypothetical protein